MPTQAGDSLPSATVFEGSPDGRVNIKDVFGDKTGVLFAVPGAFTPSCSKVIFEPSWQAAGVSLFLPDCPVQAEHIQHWKAHQLSHIGLLRFSLKPHAKALHICFLSVSQGLLQYALLHAWVYLSCL